MHLRRKLTPLRRVPIARKLADGTITEGTGELCVDRKGRESIGDFRDLAGAKLDLPPGAQFLVPVVFPPDTPG